MDAVSKFDKKVAVDLDIGEVKVSDFAAIVFVGGGGALVYEKDVVVHELINEFNSKGKIVAAICIAPRILGAAGVLMGKKATVWNEDSSQDKVIENYGADYVTDEDVVEDGQIITGNGPVCAEKFGQKIVKKLNKY